MRWELQLVSGGSGFVEYREGANVLVIELLLWTVMSLQALYAQNSQIFPAN